MQSMTRSLKLPPALVRCAQLILACGKGEPQVEIAKRLGVSKM
ncbi:MAG TPA: IS630 family transposase, partial [Synechococcus sp. UBA8638]|nr:IS630 family transposase [Synechococcus sp. UBA8638]